MKLLATTALLLATAMTTPLATAAGGPEIHVDALMQTRIEMRSFSEMLTQTFEEMSRFTSVQRFDGAIPGNWKFELPDWALPRGWSVDLPAAALAGFGDHGLMNFPGDAAISVSRSWLFELRNVAAVPEPSAMALMLAGVAMLVGLRRRKTR